MEPEENLRGQRLRGGNALCQISSGALRKLIFQAEKVRVYDYLSLFSGRKHLKDQMEVLVFPQRCVMKIHMEAGLPENEVSVDRNSLLQETITERSGRSASTGREIPYAIFTGIRRPGAGSCG